MNIFRAIIVVVAIIYSMPAMHGECNLYVGVEPSEQPVNVSEAAVKYLTSRLQQIASENEIVSDTGMSQFVLTGKFHHIVEETLPGPPIQTALHTNLTLYIGDINSQTVYAMASLELRGAGTSVERALINALRGLNTRNKVIAEFISTAKKKILKYYDANYRQIIYRATNAANSHRYEEALWLLSMIPECSQGYSESAVLLTEIYQKYIDRTGKEFYAAAQGCWSIAQDAAAAGEAFRYLQLIDPDSKIYADAQMLAEEIKNTIHDDRQFSMRQKYTDGVELERNRIECIRQIGIAYGKGQQPETNNLYWIK